MENKNQSSKKRKVFVVSGPSGSGKGTLVARLLNYLKDLQYSVSVTTRKPRADETYGKNYYFLSNKQFEDYVNKGKFLEWARVHDHFYGTLKAEVEQKLKINDVILELDTQGALQVKEKVPQAILVFIKPPSLEELEKRLRSRKTESEATIKKRLSDARKELAEVDKYNDIVVNDDLQTASQKLIEIVQRERKKN